MPPRALSRWIEVVSWTFAALGALLPFAARSVAFQPWHDALARWAYGAGTIPAADEELLGLMLGIAGGSNAGRWIVHARIARGPLAEGRPWARDLTLAALLLWFVVDSATSISTGASFHVLMFNLLPLVLVGAPLALAWRGIDAAGDEPEAAPTAASRACFWTSVFGIATGLAIAFGGTSPWFAMWFQGLEASHYGGEPIAEPARRLALFFFGPIGGCTIAQFTMLALLARREPDRARTAMTGFVSILAWFAIDSGYGFAHRGAFNVAMVNVPAVLVTLPPWLVLAHRLGSRRR